MRERGTGSVYTKRGVVWVKVSDHGKVHRESTGLKGAAGEKKAERLLSRYTEQIEKGTFDPLHARAKGLIYEDLVKLIIDDYVVNDRKSMRSMKVNLKHLAERFKGMRAQDIPRKVGDFISAKKAEGYSNGTIRLELATLKRMFSLACEGELLTHMPYIKTVKVSNARQGFFEDDQFEAVMRHLPDHLKPLAEFARMTGWRKAEMLSLTWAQVDFKAETITLEVGSTKNDDGRTYPFKTDPDLKALLRSQRQETSRLELAYGKAIPWVFHKDGDQIKRHYDAWQTACIKAACPGKLLHDLRRTAVRNLERANVARSVATSLTGHKTESVYKRYAIVSQRDQEEAVKKLAEAR